MRFIIFAILAFILYRLIKGVFGQGREIEKGAKGGVIDEMVQDPFCKTYIPRREAIRRVIGGEEYSFCSEECASKFESEAKKN